MERAKPHRLFEELIQHHRVRRVVADGVDFPLGVASYEIGVHLFHFFGHEPWNIDKSSTEVTGATRERTYWFRTKP